MNSEKLDILRLAMFFVFRNIYTDLWWVLLMLGQLERHEQAERKHISSLPYSLKSYIQCQRHRSPLENGKFSVQGGLYLQARFQSSLLFPLETLATSQTAGQCKATLDDGPTSTKTNNPAPQRTAHLIRCNLAVFSSPHRPAALRHITCHFGPWRSLGRAEE